MKKYIIYVIVLATAFFTICAASDNDDKFINALRNCTPYNVSGDLTVNGITATTVKQMRGWQNDKCTYQETISFGGNTITTVCRFSRPQIQEITSVADAYYLTQKYTGEELDTSSTEAIKNNPIAQVMNKYLQNSSVCTMQGLE